MSVPRPVYDPSAGDVALADGALAALGRWLADQASPADTAHLTALRQAGLISDEHLPEDLAGMARACHAPALHARLTSNAVPRDAWVRDDTSVLVSPRDDGLQQILAGSPAHLPYLLALEVGLGPRAALAAEPHDLRREDAERLRRGEPLDAEALVGTAPCQASSEATTAITPRRSWRVDVAWVDHHGSTRRRGLEVVDAVGGQWLVVEQPGGTVRLEPTRPVGVWLELLATLPAAHEWDATAVVEEAG